jgi:hypothetical protein
MGRMCVAGHKELEECGIKWGRMADNSEEGQGPQRAVAPIMMMMDDDKDKTGLLEDNECHVYR